MSKFFTDYQTSGTLTNPATGTKSLELTPDDRIVIIFEDPPRQLYHDMTNFFFPDKFDYQRN